METALNQGTHRGEGALLGLTASQGTGMEAPGGGGGGGGGEGREGFSNCDKK